MTNNNATYKRLGDYIREVDVRNRELKCTNLLGLSIAKAFIPSIANTVGTDFRPYKIVKHNQFAYVPVTSRNGEKITVALYDDKEDCIISQAYTSFEINDTKELLPEYLMMWFRRPEFDRYARFKSHGSAREVFDWDEMCEVMMPIPSLQEQQRIVDRYNAIKTRIENNKRTIAKLEEAAQTLYRKMFVDDINVENLPDGWRIGTLGEVCLKIGSGATPKGGKDSYLNNGISLIRSMNVFDNHFERTELAHISDKQANVLNTVTIEQYDILLNITGASVGRCCMVPMDVLPARVNQHVMIIRAKEKRFQHFLLFQINSTKVKSEMMSASESGSTREALTKSEIESQKILIPSVDVTYTFDDKAKALCDSIQIISKENEKLTELLSMVMA